MAAEPTARRDALVERLFGATVGAMDVLSVCLGVRLGLYRALADRGPSSSEWLGFGGFEILPIDNDFHRFYRLTP